MTTQQILFIDSRVTGYETLIANLDAETQWHVLDAQQDGVAQIERLLADAPALDAIQIVSHGAPGTLYLGSTVLTSSNLPDHAQQLQSIGARLTATGDLLLYGCNVAQGDEGQAFVHALAALTEADVAASTDATGRAAWGANSVLETQTGAVEASRLSLTGLTGTLAANTAPTLTVGDGRVTTDFGGDEGGNSVTVQADGKILVGGSAYANGRYNFALARYHSDGSLDTTFDTDGKVITDVGSANAYGRSITVQADGKILLGGHTGGTFALARYLSDGSLDTTFGTDGKVMTRWGVYLGASHSVTVQADGKILLGGDALGNFALTRYHSDGRLDATFGTDGKVTTDFGDASYGKSITVQADGKILLGGYADANGQYNFALARYHSDGRLDTTFDTDGKVITDVGSAHAYGNSITVQADGKILLGGHTGGKFFLARYLSNGSLDTTFDTDGMVTTTDWGAFTGGTGNSVTVQADGKILVGGHTSNTMGDYNFALARYHSDGRLDTTFDTDGKVTTHFGANAQGRSITVQADGKILLAGYSGGAFGLGGYSDGNFALARYNSNGSLDTTFSPAPTSVNTAPTGNVTITGTPKQGQPLSVSNTLADADGLGTISYQWKANGAAISGATGSTYTLTSAQVGKTITVTASYTDGQGTAEAVTSSATAAVTTAGVNTITGNSRSNTLLSTVGDDVIDGGAGLDTVSYTKAIAAVSVTLASNAAQNTGGAGTDTLLNIENLTGSKYHDKLTGNAGANRLNGGAGKDTLTGNAGNDVLTGGAGNDTLLGGEGNDILIGGTGKDVLTGGAGKDVFKFNSRTESGLTSTQRDVITDFVQGQDKIDLSAIDADTAMAGKQAFTGLIAAHEAFSQAGQLRLEAGVLYGNIDADAAAEFSIALTGVTTLAATDFIL